MAMDALELLRRDHRDVIQKLGKLSETTDGAEKTRERMLDDIGTMLDAHRAIEEEIFYPALQQAVEDDEDRRMLAEALEEHVAAAKVLDDLRKTKVGDVEFGGRVDVLLELVDHHVEEEESELFERAREVLGEDRLRELGEQMKERREALLSEPA